jgi:hypothetical protein
MEQARGASTGGGTVTQVEADCLSLTPQQLTYFDTFGFLHLPGVFRDDVDRLVDGFEEIFAANPTMDTNEKLHFDQQRRIIPGFIEKSDKLRTLIDDPRVVGIVSSLIPSGWEYAQSDGNLFYCDTSWHPDTYAAPMDRYHVKLSFYLDSLSAGSGAIRMIPGTNHHQTPFARKLRTGLGDPAAIAEVFGVGPGDIPSWTLTSQPGDLIVWNFRTIHASFNGGERRRLFSMNFREVLGDEHA